MNTRRCIWCGRPLDNPPGDDYPDPYCTDDKIALFGHLGGRIHDRRLTEFVDFDGTPSAWTYEEWQCVEVLKVLKRADWWDEEIALILAIHGWRLTQPWGSLPGDGDGDGDGGKGVAA